MTAPQIAVAFHGIGSPGRELEPGESRYWISRDKFLQFLDVVAAEPAPNQVLLTFDDANESDFSIALPALLERGLTGSFFVITSRLNRPGSLCTEQVRTLSELMEVGSHGIAHVDWRKQQHDRLDDELVGSKRILEDCIGGSVTALSIPFGRYNSRVLSAARRAGYVKIFSSDGGASQPADHPIGRTNVRADTTLQDLADLVQGRDTLTALITRHLKAIRRRFV
jgi:peptidoglycan/xylan/chitin deacetylase (PgdA/CDA1 family)